MDNLEPEIRLGPEQIARILPVMEEVRRLRSGKYPLDDAMLDLLVPMLASRGLDEPSIAYLCTTSPVEVRSRLTDQ
jgi:hypothetical protein